MKRLIFSSVIIVFCFMGCALRTRRIRAPLDQITLLYINNWTIEQSAKIATLIKADKSYNPILVVVNGNIFSSSPLTELNKGQTEIDIFNASLIDALLFNPDFLRWGIEHSKELIKNANFYCLGANIKDNRTGRTIGQEFLFQRLGSAQIAVLGLSYDSADYYFKQKYILFQAPDFTVLKFKPLIENHSDLQFIITNTSDTLDFPYDLILGAPTKTEMQLLPWAAPGIYKIIIGYDRLKNIHQIQRTNLSLDTIAEDEAIKKIILSYQAKTDSILNRKYQNLTKINHNWAIKTLLTETNSQAYLADQPLINKPLSNKTFLFSEFYNALNEKNSLPIITIKGKELKKVSKQLIPVITNIIDNKDYRILTNIDFLSRNPLIKFDGLEFSSLAIWEILYNNLMKMEPK